MRWLAFVISVTLCFGTLAFAQQAQDQSPEPNPPAPNSEDKQEQKKALDRDSEAGESSSRETHMDTAPPKDDDKNHPNSGVALEEANGGGTTAPSDVQEMHLWNPYRAVKDDEVGDFYFKRGNYKAAAARYEDALQYKEHDALANFGLGQCYEKMNQPEDAIAHYKEYLKILPQGPDAKQAKKALERLGAKENKKTASK